MRCSSLAPVTTAICAILAAGCGSPSTGTTDETGSGGASGGSSGETGGTTGTGGRAATGGTTGTGGAIGTGGATATGGTTGTGGVKGTGGTTATGGANGTGGVKGTGGATATGGTTGTGGAKATGGAIGTGGAKATGGTTGTGGLSGTGGSTGTGGAMAADKVFNPCRFHFGTIDTIAKQNPSMIPQLDFFTPGWMGQSDTFDMSSVCTEANAGGALASQVPVIVAYVAAFYVKRHDGLCDCNVTTCGANKDLCHQGAADITAAMSSILNVYKSYAQGFASCYGTTRPIVFEMEPDFYQYTGSTETSPWTFQQAGQIMGQFVAAIKQYLPNAAFSMDISPWVGTNNNTGSDGSDNGKNWYSNFDMTQFTFINTSGGSTDAATAKIRGDAMTWAGVSQVTGKPILADTGYGINGSSAGPDPAWDNVANINARIADGVISISQYNPSSTWGTTISGNRASINMPKFCP